MATTPNLYWKLVEGGWTALDARTHPRAYMDSGGKRYGTLEKAGVRIALSLNQCLVLERGDVFVYQSDQDIQEAILQALIVAPESRQKGKATAALQELGVFADACQTTIYLEPAPIEDKPMLQSQLANFYRRHGFSQTDGQCRVMVRPCGMPTKPERPQT